MKRPSPSEYAQLRATVTLRDLKLYDELRTDDTVTFTYMKCKYRARVSREAQLITRAIHAPQHGVPPLGDATDTAYDAPTSFAKDCVAEYCRQCGATTNTNPNGWERVVRDRDGVSLGTLRDRVAQRYLPSAAALADAVPRRRRGPSVDEASEDESTAERVTRLLDNDLATLNGLRAFHGDAATYKTMAADLELVVARLLRSVDEYEALIVALLERVPGHSPVVAQARELLERRRVAAGPISSAPVRAEPVARIRQHPLDVAALIRAALTPPTNVLP